MVLYDKSLKNCKTPQTTTSDTSTTQGGKSASVGQQTDGYIVETPLTNQVSASKSDPLTRVKAVVITAKAKSSAPAVLSSATKLLVNDILTKTPVGGVADNGSSSSSTLTWMDFTDLFSTSVESLSKLCGEASQQRTKQSSADDASPNSAPSGSEASADLLKVFALNWFSNDSCFSNTNSRYSETDLNSHFQTANVVTNRSSQTALPACNCLVSKVENLEYNSVDKLELRLAIAKATNFNEFVRLYFNNGKSGFSPTLPQIIKLAELLFKDYQQSVLQLSDA